MPLDTFNTNNTLNSVSDEVYKPKPEVTPEEASGSKLIATVTGSIMLVSTCVIIISDIPSYVKGVHLLKRNMGFL